MRCAYATVIGVALGLAILLDTVCASAQSPFKHIIIAIQENRTPDNLFSGCSIAGADVQKNGGSAIPLAGGTDIGHSHNTFLHESSGNWPARAYNYVDPSYIVPYCQLASQYGFANRFFQTNQGPSFPAHQFLVSGSSSPDDNSDLLVSGERLTTVKNFGCKSLPGAIVPTIDPAGNAGPPVFPCFSRSSLLEVLDAAGLSWRYYSAGLKQQWMAPAALSSYYLSPNLRRQAQLLTDIASGQLANVTWVTPPGACSDHPTGNKGCGPAWIASLVNAIMESPFWQDTAILITWDDWGGWYDHVAPLANHTGFCPSYCYGFRVPLLVISASTPKGYISNAPMDFGTLLRFVEKNFSLSRIGNGNYADAYSNPFDMGFFSAGQPRNPSKIHSRKVTQAELEARIPLDDD